MRRTSFESWPCSVARTTDLLGDWWTPLVLREAFYGTRRFEDFQSELGIARATLTERLRRLVELDIMAKRPYQDQPLRHEYVLTEKGRDFFGVLMAMVAWGDRWLADEAGPPVLFEHRPCGHHTHADVVCDSCGEPLRPADVRPRFGPGYPSERAALPRARERFADS
ncbi:helix-turn-helix transcriptional regulator [Streptomyces sp. LP11]|uniref:Helix-turn-helix transcriptional regulator n=1 Tax=Streptomyces pyxinicus TaxID=2970331 RepID=A0ABT2AYS7_9ACTN|nr:helix-turn-helix domain-containing protein [Streptomyces sp. LP11]MCS0601397.1 helix-turn-helix transcriptional regulator [Streptomyces sp. LP11]